MPPRRYKVTPKAAAAPTAPPSGPTRRTTRSKISTLHKKVSPKIVVKKVADSDEVFRTQEGGTGSLTYDGQERSPIHDSDLDEEEISPTPGPSKKKAVPIKAKKVAGSRRIPPRPIKRKAEVVLPRTRAVRRRAPAPQSASSDIEIIEDIKSANDEGYESAAPSDEGNIEPASEEEDNGEPMEVDPWHVSSDDVDENGNLKSLIDDEDSSSGEDEGDGMEVDESGEEDEDEQQEGGDVNGQQESSPLPLKISAPRVPSKKRTAVNLSDAEDMPATTKRRTSASKDATKAIKAVGHTAEVVLKFRDQVDNDDILPKKSIKRKPKHVHVEVSEENSGKDEAQITVKDIKDVLTHKSKGKKKDEAPQEEISNGVQPQDAGCDVTDPSKQCVLLQDTYVGLEPLTNAVVECTNQVQLSNPDVLGDKSLFANIDLRSIKRMLSTKAIPTVHLFVPGRAGPKHLVQKPQGTGTAIFSKSAPGEVADILIFGFVLGSKVIEGRSYNTSMGVTCVLKELEVLPLQQDWERALATLSMSLGSKLVNLTVTDEGAITFSTKHTAVDDDGNAEKKKSLGGNFLAKAPKALARNVIHPDIQRRPRDGTDNVPVFNSTSHFLKDGSDPKLGPEDVLTQRKKADPYWSREIPQGSLVAVHSTVSLFTSAKGAKAKFMSFNLLAVQILALPNDA